MAGKKIIPYGTLVLLLSWIVVLGAAALFWASIKPEIPDDLKAIVRTDVYPLHSFSLVDQRRQPFNLDRMKGKWTFLFFGYTYCPDICPTSLSVIKTVYDAVKVDKAFTEDLQVVFVSVDPQRDPPEVLASYMSYFDPDFLGVTGLTEEINKLAAQFGARYIKEAGGARDDYLISHTSTIFLADPNARFLARFSTPHDPGVIAEQFRKIQALE